MNRFFASALTFALLSSAADAQAPSNTDNSMGHGSANPVNNSVEGSMAVYPPSETAPHKPAAVEPRENVKNGKSGHHAHKHHKPGPAGTPKELKGQ